MNTFINSPILSKLSATSHAKCQGFAAGMEVVDYESFQLGLPTLLL